MYNILKKYDTGKSAVFIIILTMCICAITETRCLEEKQNKSYQANKSPYKSTNNAAKENTNFVLIMNNCNKSIVLKNILWQLLYFRLR